MRSPEPCSRVEGVGGVLPFRAPTHPHTPHPRPHSCEGELPACPSHGPWGRLVTDVALLLAPLSLSLSLPPSLPPPGHRPSRQWLFMRLLACARDAPEWPPPPAVRWLSSPGWTRERRGELAGTDRDCGHVPAAAAAAAPLVDFGGGDSVMSSCF